jgi:ketosteroid isomerase-like protein
LEDCIHPEVAWLPITAALEGGTAYRGRDGVRRWAEQLFRDWEVFEIYVDDTREIGHDRLLALGSWKARGQGSGVEISQGASWLAEFREGKMARMQTFTDQAEALEAVGLSE